MLFVTLLGVLSLAFSINAQTASNYNCPSGRSYTVQSGNTYCSIASSLGCSSYASLQSANGGVAPTSLQQGQTFCIPSTCTGSAQPSDCSGTGSSTSCRSYTIQPGDTYCSIAAKYGCSSYASLQTANGGIAPASLQPLTDTFCLPSTCTGTAQPSDCSGTGSSTSCRSYTVQPGDTYCSIAAKYGCSSYASLQTANGGIAPANLQPLTDTFCLPSTCTGTATPSDCSSGPSTTTCANGVATVAAPTIPSGSTYCQFAQQYGCANVSTLEAANNYPVYALPPGQTMCIPASGCSNSPLSYTPNGCCAANNCPSGYSYYCVQPNDSWCSIAAATGCNNFATLQAAAGNTLAMGQALCIPNSCGNGCAATVTLSSTTTYASIESQYNCNLGNYYSGNGCAAPTSGTVCIPNSCPLYNGMYNGVFYCNGVASNSTGYCNGQFYCNGNALNNGYCNGVLYCNGAPATSSTTGYCGSTFVCNGVAQSSATLYYCNGNYYCGGQVANGVCGGYYFTNGQYQYYCGYSASTTATTCSAFAAAHGITAANVAACNGITLNASGNCNLAAGTYTY